MFEAVINFLRRLFGIPRSKVGRPRPPKDIKPPQPPTEPVEKT